MAILIPRGNLDIEGVYRRPSLFTVLLFEVLTIHIHLKRNLTSCLCSKSGLAIRGFAIHIQIFLEPNPREYRGKPVFTQFMNNSNLTLVRF
jgi:hypothetical protein